MEYFYYFANTQLVSRLLAYLSRQVILSLDSVTVIYLVDRWIVRVKLRESLLTQQDLNFKAFLNENGYPYQVTSLISSALRALDAGISITEVMTKYHVVVVSHGALNPTDIEDFRKTFVKGLGYCPPSLV